jgi:hypothetical protein
MSYIDSDVIYLRASIDLNKQIFQFSYSTDNINFTQCGEPFFIHFGHWKGVRTGLYCYNMQKDSGTASFLWYKYRHDGP